MLAQLAIMLEPPAGGACQQQEMRPPLPQPCQVGDRLGDVVRMVTGVVSVLVLSEVPPLPPLSEYHELFVALAHHRHSGVWRDHCISHLPNAIYQPTVGEVLAQLLV